LFELSAGINKSQVPTNNFPRDGCLGAHIETIPVETILTEIGSFDSRLGVEPESIDSCALETFSKVLIGSGLVGSPALRRGQECCVEEKLGVLYG
jgi:hypothetical protein